ncbi:MAG: Gx transporter family protein [Lachnospiraceae bacterium]|nr:Gx transporter family protein [Lachnospiraceae bacterium]
MRKTAELGFFLAVALILSYVESLIPITFGIPGIKLGLPNLIVVLLLFGQRYGAKEALLVNGMRIVLSGFMFSNLYAILYALAGAAFSFIAMLIGKRLRCFSVIGVSVLGGVFHNIGQAVVAMIVVETFAVSYYIPFLIVAGMITGAFLGLIVMEIIPYLDRYRQCSR